MGTQTAAFLFTGNNNDSLETLKNKIELAQTIDKLRTEAFLLKQQARQYEQKADMLSLALIHNNSSDAEFNTRLSIINKASKDISERNRILQLKNDSVVKEIKKSFDESAKKAISRAPKLHKRNTDEYEGDQ